MAFEARAWGLALRIVALAVAGMILLWLLVRLLQVLLLAAFAVTLAAGLAPVVRHLQQMRVPRAAAILIVYAVTIGLIVGFGALLLPVAVTQLIYVVERTPEYVSDVADWLQRLQHQFPFLPVAQIQDSLQQAVGDLIGQFNFLVRAAQVGSFLISIGDAFVTITVLLLSTFFLINDSEKVRDYCLSFLAPRLRPEGRVIAERIGRRLGGWLVGQVLLSVAVGTLDLVGLLILGIPSPALLAVWAGMTELVPIIGPFLGGAPAVLVALFQSPLKALATLGLYVLVQQIENHLLVPNLLGRAVRLHPLAVVFALTAGAKLFGLFGAILAVPVATMGAVILDEWRHPNGLTERPRGEGPTTGQAAPAQDVSSAAEIEIANQERGGEAA